MRLSPQWTTLDASAIHAYLQQYGDSAPLALPVHIHIYDELASTNQTLWQLIHQGAKAGTVAIARQQSAGKGQRGHQWVSAIGGLYLSLALEPDLPVQQAPHLILSAVCGVALALRSCHVPVLIKWPNDLVIPIPQTCQRSKPPHGHKPLQHPQAPQSTYPPQAFQSSHPQPYTQDLSFPLDGPTPLYKLGGILTETRMKSQSIRQAVVGIGLNGANTVPPPGINLMELWHRLKGGQMLPCPLDTLNGLGAIAIQGLCAGWSRLQGEGIAPILQDYNQLLVHRDHQIAVEWEKPSPTAGQRQWQWVRILGVTETGYLRLQPLPLTAPNTSSTSSALFAPKQTLKINNKPNALTGTSSTIQSSTEEILMPPGTIQLGYHSSSND